MKTGKFTCFYAASTSRRTHTITRKKAHKLLVTSSAGCSPTYLPFAGQFTRGMIADCLQLQVFLLAIADIFVCNAGIVPAIAGIFACICEYFYLQLLVFLPANWMYIIAVSPSWLIPGVLDMQNFSETVHIKCFL